MSYVGFMRHNVSNLSQNVKIFSYVLKFWPLLGDKKVKLWFSYENKRGEDQKYLNSVCKVTHLFYRNASGFYVYRKEVKKTVIYTG